MLMRSYKQLLDAWYEMKILDWKSSLTFVTNISKLNQNLAYRKRIFNKNKKKPSAWLIHSLVYKSLSNKL